MLRPITRASDVLGGRAPRFIILAMLGRGGMGEVLLAEDRVLKRRVALKAIRPEHSQDRDSCERLVREAERASQLNDEHIARIYDIAEHDGRMFIIMEYVEGETLRDKMREALPVEQFFNIAEQCLAGLAAAHRRGMLHCDLKPENLMITPAGLVKILDFGLSQQATEETKDSLEFSSPAIGGTPAYMAPEVLRGKMPDQRADVFSVGVVLYEALAGFHPFREGPPELTVNRILRSDPRPLSGPLPAGLDRVLLRMLAKDPSRRYQRCEDVLSDLVAVHAGVKPTVEKTAGTRARFSAARTGALAGVVILGIFLTLWHARPTAPRPPPSNRQLVVLPFRAASADGSYQAFASGLTETLSAKLGQIAERYPLEIVAASEVRGHKVTDAQQARSVLGANLALEGTLQQSRDTVRITYSLLDTASGRQVHSGVITADASNPFAVQDRVIDEVLRDLDIDLKREDRGRMASHGTEQPEAYYFYLRGRGYLQEYDRPENLENAIAAFRQSLQADPRFGLAYAALGQSYLRTHSMSQSPESVMQAQMACSRAIELDPARADGEICMGMLFNATGNYEKAEHHLRRAVKLDPGRDESSSELALAYEGLKRLDDAERSLKTAIASRPQYWAGYERLGAFYNAHGRYDDAAEQFKRVIELAPDSFTGYANLGGNYVRQGKYADAIEVLERSIAIRPTSQALNNLGAAFFYQGRYQEAAGTYERAAQMTPDNNVIFGNLGEAYGLIKGKQMESRKNYREALRLTEQGLSVNPKEGQALSHAALYAARLGERAKAERFRKLSLRLSAQDPRTRLRSALVLAQWHEDRRALAELDQAIRQGLSTSEITNDPAWRRFESYPAYTEIIARDQKK